MPKPKNEPDHEDSEALIMERMNKALKAMMSTPPETHKEMVARRQKSDQRKPKKRKQV